MDEENMKVFISGFGGLVIALSVAIMFLCVGFGHVWLTLLCALLFISSCFIVSECGYHY